MVYWRSVFLVLMGACSYGVLAVFMKFAFIAGFSPYELSGAQLFFGSVLMSIIALLLSRERFTFRHVFVLLPASVMMACTSIFYHQAVSEVSASLAIVLLFQFTWIGVLIEAAVNRKKPSPQQLLSLLLLGVGTVFASGLVETGIQQISLKGLICGLLSGFTYAMVIFFSGRLGVGMDPYLRSAVSITSAAVLLSLVYPPVFLLNGRLWDGLLTYGILVACFGSLIPILCLTVGVPRIGSGLATILCAVELPTVVFLSSSILLEPVSLAQWSGVTMILVAIALPQLKVRQLFSTLRTSKAKSP
ncbi:DMT family transporter [Brevibacillus sp. H7]|jgi:drug/metabolite transporter (DMT)-like permease|uniref:DMT family transporter n=1 Tax=Brevibacillus sp. H7 TaxID=3349138 RepID=UPI003803B91B